MWVSKTASSSLRRQKHRRLAESGLLIHTMSLSGKDCRRPVIFADEADFADEEDLIEQAQSDPAAFGRLYDAYYSSIFNYILRMTGDIELAQDITAETFYKAMKGLKRFEWRGLSFSAWLYKIATNEARSYFRKGTYKTASLDYLLEAEGLALDSGYDLEAEFIEVQDALNRYEEFLACRKKISELPFKYQEVIVLRFFEAKRIKEIGSILGKSEGTVKSLLHRGLERLRKSMDK